ncbi:hypothetical protein NDR86_10680 [Nocardia sp. CDC141]|uniref:Uncharacterized protein n=1 Tax=Nocardia pulmonis TaxID=2951408 RepID=A0A9X2IYH8_9NOCA|nr:hypothetical protein [Nocardia sp. CDC159]MCM6773936.1 hypothetical protein [Nocardia pulmonis]
MTGIVAMSVTASGVSGSDSSERTSAPMLRTTCDAAATGSVFATEQRPDTPFTIQLPRLTGWQVRQGEGGDLVLYRLDRHAGRIGGATVTVGVSRPAIAVTTITAFMVDDTWQQSRSETVGVCGQRAIRASGIEPASGADGVDLYHEYLGFSYMTDGMKYPIGMSAKATAADRDRYQPDIDAFVDGLQIVRIPPTS